MSEAPIATRGASAGALILVAGVVVLLALAGTAIPAYPQVLGTATFTSTPAPTSTFTPTPTWTPSPTPLPTSTPTPSRTPLLAPTPTVATPTPAPAVSHLWLEFPLPAIPEGDRYPSSYFPYGSTGGGRYHLHHGVDYMNPAGTPVLAPAAGTVLIAGNDREIVYGVKTNFYGNLVITELDQRFQGQPVYLLFGHLSEVSVRVGQHVEVGEMIGRVGMTGVAIGNHLHMEVRLGANRYENTRNPVLWLRPEPGQGIIAGQVVDAQGRPIPETTVTFFRAAEPNKWWRQTLTYADREVNPDDRLGENFALGYVPAGDYLVKVKIGRKSVVKAVTVVPGEIAYVQLVAQE